MNDMPMPPHAPEAEMAVLGSMMIEKEAAERALEMLDETQFYSDAHRKLFRVLEGLHRAGKGIDLVTVGEELRKLKLLAGIGGLDTLNGMVHKGKTAAHVGHYARIVHDKAVLRDLIRNATGILQDCYSEKDTALLLDESQARILSVAQRQTSNKFASTQVMMHAAIENIERLHMHKKEVSGVSTGFKALDAMTSGLHPGNLILLAGRPGHGKTSLAMNIAANVILRKEAQAVAFFSMEMSQEDIADRLIACEAGVSLQKIRSGYFKREHWPNLTGAAARLAEAPLFVDDSPGLSVLEVRGRARRLPPLGEPPAGGGGDIEGAQVPRQGTEDPGPRPVAVEPARGGQGAQRWAPTVVRPAGLGVFGAGRGHRGLHLPRSREPGARPVLGPEEGGDHPGQTAAGPDRRGPRPVRPQSDPLHRTGPDLRGARPGRPSRVRLALSPMRPDYPPHPALPHKGGGDRGAAPPCKGRD